MGVELQATAPNATMQFLSSVLAALTLLLPAVSAQKYVFAHVVVGDTAAHTQATWTTDITLAQNAAIDAFILNVGYGDSNIPTQVANAFAAAEAAGSSFKLAFSFDYLGGTGAWPATGDDSVASYLTQYASSPAYFQYGGGAFVSTFEGTGNVADWAPGGAIRSAVGSIYFVPSWTSLGPGGITADLDNIEGFFSWDMWPNGATNITDASDVSWKNAVSGKTYMMGVSPWFFHSASGGTDWVWRGDDLVSDTIFLGD
jgi:glucan endo-1,3-alpha-glucosidase